MSDSSIHIDYFEALAKLTRSQKAELKDFSESVEEIIQTAVDTLKVESINLWLINQEKNQIECVAHCQKNDLRPFVFNPLTNTDLQIYLNQLQEGTMLVSNNVFEDQRLYELATHYFLPNDIYAIIDFPIYIEGEFKAILCCNHIQKPRKWAINEQQFVLAIGNIVALLLEVWEHRKAEQKLISHDRLLRGVNSCMFQLFSNPDFFEGLDTVIRTIGKTTETDRVFIFQNFLDENKEECCKIIKEWTSQDNFRQIHKSQWLHVNYRQAELTRWRDVLKSGQGIRNIADHLTDKELRHLWSTHAKSTLIVPIFVNEKEFWGFIGLEDCKGKHEWTITEESSIFNLAIAIGGILTKIHVENLYRDQNSQLKKTNEELDHFVYSISHDLRAPLTSVIGILQLLKTDKSNLDLYLDLITQSISRLDNYIREVLSISRNKRTQVSSELINIEEVIEEIKQELEYLDDAKQVLITLHIDNPEKKPFYTDRLRFKTILDNLISNGIRYRNPYQEQSKVEISIMVSGELIKIKVSDNGLGITSNHIPLVFDMFYRANDTKVGSGLGLYIVKETVEKLGGTIQIASIPNVGTTFSMQIPNHV